MPKIIQQLYGKVLIFRFKLNSNNLTEGRQGYLVKRTYIPDDKLEKKFMNDDADKVSHIFLQDFNVKMSYCTHLFILYSEQQLTKDNLNDDFIQQESVLEDTKQKVLAQNTLLKFSIQK